MRTAEFKQVGEENELIPRGLDPYLWMEFRKQGKRVVVVPGVVYHHLPPERLSRLLRQFYRNGIQAAFTNRHYPEWAIETPSRHGPFQTHFFCFQNLPFSPTVAVSDNYFETDLVFVRDGVRDGVYP